MNMRMVVDDESIATDDEFGAMNVESIPGKLKSVTMNFDFTANDGGRATNWLPMPPPGGG
jgi:hypothetical protein